ncbi:MAG TPA: response regulator transcription factor [Candidatus Acidoferrales bacterium]|nr:response regulator transcription factor [Candidatus Acidoferrales bacterium]
MKKREQVRILLANDHPVVREGLVSLIRQQKGMQVIGVATNGREAVANFVALHPDLVLLDLRMPGTDGIQALTAIRRLDPAARILMLSGFGDEEEVYHALAAGARGYVLKDSTLEELFASIRAVAQGKAWVPPGVASKLAARLSRHELSPRERDVLGLLTAGKSNKEIAVALRITEGTVKVHVDHILKKFNVRGRTEATAMAFRLGIVRLEQ